MENNKNYFFGFDYLRAGLCIFVVAWHNVIFGPPTVLNSSMIEHLSPTVADIIYFNILLLAVPTFFLTSIFLYVLLRQHRPANYFIDRMKRFASLLIFWSVTVSLYRYMMGWNLNDFFNGRLQTTLTIVTGGRSVFYYFFSLIVLTGIAEAFFLFTSKIKRHKNFILWVALAFSLIILIIAPRVLAQYKIAFDFWSPFNFIPYAFCAFIIADYSTSKHYNTITAVLFLLYLVFSVMDWMLIKYYIWDHYRGYIMPTYARISIPFGAMFLVLLCSRIARPPAKIISHLAQYSLGIYCFHTFISEDRLSKLFAFSSSQRLLNFLVQIGGSIILTAVFKRVIWLRNFV